MSNAFAIAGVTAALKTALNDALSVAGLDAALGGSPGVSALPPDRVNPANGADPNQLNLFLYAVSPNPGWCNVRFPSRDSFGDRVDNPPLALDLHYLLTAYAATDLGAEILLGHGMQALHETPFFTRQRLKDLLKETPNEIPKALETTGLPEQVEQLKISPKPMNLDEMSKLWTSVQGRYRVTVGYLVTVVLIESRRSVKTALPVRERNIPVVPLQDIVIDAAVNAAGDTLPVQAGDMLRLRGHGLAASGAKVLLGSIDLSSDILRSTDTEMDVALQKPLPVGLRAGLTPVQVVHPVPGTVGFASNLVAFALRPAVSAPAFAVGKVTATLAPKVTKPQRVVLLLNERQPPPDRRAFAYRFEAPPDNGIVGPATESATVSFAIKNVSPATYLVRVQVDGAESLLTTDPQGRYDAPNVVIP